MTEIDKEIKISSMLKEFDLHMTYEDDINKQISLLLKELEEKQQILF